MSDSPRLLLLTDKFAPHTGGTAVIYGKWCERLPSGSVAVCTSWFPGWREYDAGVNYTLRRVPFINIPKLRMPLVWFGIWAAAEREVRRRRPDVVHAGQILETGLLALNLRRRYGVPYVVHTYGEEINYYAQFPRTRRWMRAVLENASAVTSISRYTQGRMAALGLHDGPVTLLYPGVETERFKKVRGVAIRDRLGLGNAPVLLTVARLLERKGHDRVIEALQRIRQEVPDARYLIVGSGKEEPRLRALAERLGHTGAVQFAGSVPHAEIPNYFAAADVFLHPNRQLANGDIEGFGIVFLEAGACGLPVIGGNSGGTPDAICDGETGFLVDPDNVEEIADRAALLLKDAALRRRMGEAGRDWAAGFTWDAPAAKVWDLTTRIAAHGP